MAEFTVLFLCTGNACRSQMAEGWARHLRGEGWSVLSAGTRPTQVDPRAVAVMAEAGVDIAGQRSKAVAEHAGRAIDLAVTVCDHAREACPVFPGAMGTIHQGFPDPPALAADSASEAEALDHYRRVRDAIRDFVAALPGPEEKD